MGSATSGLGSQPTHRSCLHRSGRVGSDPIPPTLPSDRGGILRGSLFSEAPTERQFLQLHGSSVRLLLPTFLHTTHRSVFSTSYFLLTTHCSLLTPSYVLLTTSYFLLPTHHSLLTAHYSLLPMFYSLLPTSYLLLTWLVIQRTLFLAVQSYPRQKGLAYRRRYA